MQKNLTIKELPDTERPYEKCLLYGAGSLSDAELISVIIRTGSRGERCVDLAHRILNAGPDGLLNLIRLDTEQLTGIRGIGPVKAVQLKCIGELARRIAVTQRKKQISLQSPESIASYFMEKMRHERKEQLMLAMFDSKGMLLGERLLFCRNQQRSIDFWVKDIYRAALQEQAVYIVILHNHPSGNPEPSREDILITRKIRECGELLDILLMDHIIIGDNEYFSHEQDILYEKGRE